MITSHVGPNELVKCYHSRYIVCQVFVDHWFQYFIAKFYKGLILCFQLNILDVLTITNYRKFSLCSKQFLCLSTIYYVLTKGGSYTAIVYS